LEFWDLIEFRKEKKVKKLPSAFGISCDPSEIELFGNLLFQKHWAKFPPNIQKSSFPRPALLMDRLADVF